MVKDVLINANSCLGQRMSKWDSHHKISFHLPQWAMSAFLKKYNLIFYQVLILIDIVQVLRGSLLIWQIHIVNSLLQLICIP